jgi:hypothetical protein
MYRIQRSALFNNNAAQPFIRKGWHFNSHVENSSKYLGTSINNFVWDLIENKMYIDSKVTPIGVCRRGNDRILVRFTTLQLPMQSVPITNKVVRSNPVHDEVH